MKRLPRLATRDWIGLGLVLVGFLLRLRQYLTGRSLWLDEAMLANNILGRDFAGLFQQLDNNQGAPIGFLLLQKSITLILGDSEYALRLFPFVAGLVALAAMFALTRRISNPFPAAFALAFFAVTPSLIYYASEVKQYSSDVAITLLFCLLFLKYTQSEIKPKNAVLLALAGALAVWFSHPALFVTGALGLALFIPAARAKDKSKIVALLFVAAFWFLNLGALYFVNLRQLSTHQFFLDFWSAGFIPHDSSAFAWLANSLDAPFRELLGLQTDYTLTAILFLGGLLVLVRQGPRFGFFLLAILFLSLLASYLTLYPFAGRMILFLAPILILALAEGIEAIANLIERAPDLTGFAKRLFDKASWRDNGFGQQEPLRKPVRSLSWTARILLAGYLLFGPLSVSAENFITPKYHEHIRPTMEYLRDYRRDGDLVYVYYWAEHAVRYYAPKYGMDMSAFIIGEDHHTNPEAYRVELDRLRGHERVWFLFSHVYESGDFNERDYILDYLNSIGKLLRKYRVAGTSVYLYLYDLSNPLP